MAERGTTVLKWDHWHIEASSICTLQCPRCPRSEVPESLLNRQLSLHFFKNQIGTDVIQKIRKITFCGNDGDPIYCKDFLDIVAWIKQVNPDINLVIITNGSFKNSVWWTQLASLLNHRDELHFSIDGLEHTNHVYRVNSNWDSIASGIETFRKHNQSTYLVWAAIGFRFNQDIIDNMKYQASAWKFDLFQLTKSTKFGSKYPQAYGTDDTLEPSDPELVAAGHRFERVPTRLSDRDRPGQELKQIFLQRSQQLGNHSGICLIGNKGVFLSSQGEFYPCCWTANRYEHNRAWQGKFNLNTRTFNDIIQDTFWTTEFLKFNSWECKNKCTPDKLKDTNHTTEW